MKIKVIETDYSYNLLSYSNHEAYTSKFSIFLKATFKKKFVKFLTLKFASEARDCKDDMDYAAILNVNTANFQCN